MHNGVGMDSKLNEIEMRKFETKDELAEWIETMHLQNTNGRETELEMFRLGIEAAIEELTEFNLFSIPVVVDMLPDLKEIADAKKKYIDRKMITGYSTKPDGVGNHFQDGVNWALNYVTSKTKGN